MSLYVIFVLVSIVPVAIIASGDSHSLLNTTAFASDNERIISRQSQTLPSDCITYVPITPHRAAQDCGVWTIDCSKGPAACDNACFWHYCLADHDDDYQYADGGGEPKCLDKNGKTVKGFVPNGDRSRNLSGVRTRDKSPCTAHPLVQRVFDPNIMSYADFNDWRGANLQCDEWPMAAFDLPDFKTGMWPPRNSLTCIPADDNRNIGMQYKFFRNAAAQWKPSSGANAHERTCPGESVKGDKFKVRFDISGVDRPDLYTPHCVPPPAGKQRVCTNFGAFPHFYMTNYRPQGGQAKYGETPGRLSFPYMSDLMNTYRMAGDKKDLELYKVVVRRSGPHNEHFVVKLYRRKSVGRDELVAEHPGQDLEVNDDITIPGTGGREDFGLIREIGCSIHSRYGSFYWNSGDEGWNTGFSERFKLNKDIKPWNGVMTKSTRNPAFQMPGAYCITGSPGSLDDSNDIDEGIRNGNRVTGNPNSGESQTMCWFAGQ